MKYKESREEAAEYTRLALPLLAKYKLPTDPTNYAVSYEYVSGKNQNLINAINGLEEKGQPLTAEVSAKLYHYYLEDSNEPELNEMRENLRRIFSEILSQIVTTGGETEHFRHVLEKYSNSLVDSATPEAIKKIVSSVVEETRGMQESNRLLEQKLKSNAEEMETLRHELIKAREEALVDTLTQLANRKAFNQKLEYSVQSLNGPEKQEPLSLLLIDIDFFKKINDSHGHLVGDEILRLAASVMNESVKGQDLVSRFGGDEFSILLPETPISGAITVANKLLQSIQNKQLRRKSTGDSLEKITFSIGAASYRQGESLEFFIKRADDALYQSKKSGRNRVSADSDTQDLRLA